MDYWRASLGFGDPVIADWLTLPTEALYQVWAYTLRASTDITHHMTAWEQVFVYVYCFFVAYGGLYWLEKLDNWGLVGGSWENPTAQDKRSKMGFSVSNTGTEARLPMQHRSTWQGLYYPTAGKVPLSPSEHSGMICDLKSRSIRQMPPPYGLDKAFNKRK